MTKSIKEMLGEVFLDLTEIHTELWKKNGDYQRVNKCITTLTAVMERLPAQEQRIAELEEGLTQVQDYCKRHAVAVKRPSLPSFERIYAIAKQALKKGE